VKLMIGVLHQSIRQLRTFTSLVQFLEEYLRME
jgi:hypothetical protein